MLLTPARTRVFGRSTNWVHEMRSHAGHGSQEPRGRDHEPVMVREILEDFALRPGMTVVDGTLGLGGHALRLIEHIQPGGTLVGLDWDESMLEIAIQRLKDAAGVRLILERADFRTLAEIVEREALSPDAILLDLGLNSAQVDDPQRGLSFREEGILDMRMDRTRGEPASALLNRMALGELESAIRELGDERWAHAIARKIVERRKDSPLRTTKDLVGCVLAAIPVRAREQRIHPATRTFQAIRILVNGELEGLREALLDAAGTLAPGGVLSVLAYHSGEDRIVKRAFRELELAGFSTLHAKPLGPTVEEVRRNPRSRSAKLRSIAAPGTRRDIGHSER